VFLQYLLKKPAALKLNRSKSNSTTLGPFDDVSPIEFFAQKANAGLFAFATHSKKRPHNVVIGRLFDDHVLDMVEFGVKAFKSIEESGFKRTTQIGTKPIIVLSSPLFRDDEKWKMIGNLLVDFFCGQIVDEINLKGLELAIALTISAEGILQLRTYFVLMKKSNTRVPKVELAEMGPNIDLELRRERFGDASLRKEALKQPREMRPTKEKSVETNVMGEKLETVHMQRQDLDELARSSKPSKALRVEQKRKRREAAAHADDEALELVEEGLEEPPPKRRRDE